MDRDDGAARIGQRDDGQPFSAIPGCILLGIGLLFVLLLALGWML